MGVLSKIVGFFGGGTAKVATDVAGGIADIVERWKPGEGKKQEMQMEVANFLEKSIADARQHDQPMNSGIAIIDALVNGVNRMIRPWVTVTLLGSLFGLGETWPYFKLPPPDTIAPQYWEMSIIVLGFWFGGRFLVKDIPQAIKSVVK
jgi:hypothetical protein